MLPEPALIDTRMGGNPGQTAAFLVVGEQVALVDTGPAASVGSTAAAIDATGVEGLDWIVITHVHLDHAGAAGHLAARHPRARIVAPERVCRHLEDPAALYAGTREVWGERTDSLLGAPLPVPASRLVPISAGGEVDLGGRRLLAHPTPGHTRHHFSYLDSASNGLISGDAVGIRLPGSDQSRPATPPTDFSLDDALGSIKAIQALAPDRLLISHFGLLTGSEGSRSVEEACERAAAELRRWCEAVSVALAEGPDDPSRRTAGILVAGMGPDERAAWTRLEAVNPTWLNVAGIAGDLERRADADEAGS